MTGRAYLWGLMAGGEAGVDKVFHTLRTELDRAMRLLGVETIEELKRRGPTLVMRRHPSSRDYPDRAAWERGYGGGII
jgi:L-lactate dehydrogenase (cytochrome)